MKKILLTGIMVILALSLVTCMNDISDDGVENDEWQFAGDDWKLSKPDANGNKRLTIYFDDVPGAKNVKASIKKSERKVGLGLAHMSHDYFEAVFWGEGTIARATWELGQNAGIRGVYRPATGVNYTSYDGTAATTAATVPADALGYSTVFVGRKADRTLLALGYLSHIDDVLLYTSAGTLDPAVSPLLTPATKSVTFTVIPITNNVAMDTTTNKAPDKASFYTTAGIDTYDATAGTSGTAGKIVTSVVTGGVNSGEAWYGLPVDAVYSATPATNYTNARMTPLGGVDYPMFVLPEVKPAITSQTIYAKYHFTFPFTAAPTLGTFPGYRNMSEAARVINIPSLYPTIIKREVRFLDAGQLMYAQTALPDAATEVSFSTDSALAPLKGPIPTSADGASNGEAFNPELNIVFKMYAGSNQKIFSIVFQVPVYALTNGFSTNVASTTQRGEKWFIRPGWGVPLYNLDNGKDAGGCVLLGTGVTSLDMLEIKVIGVGLTPPEQPTLPNPAP